MRQPVLEGARVSEQHSADPLCDRQLVKKIPQSARLGGGEFANCEAEQVAAIARDIGIGPQELQFIASRGPQRPMSCQDFSAHLRRRSLHMMILPHFEICGAS
jgi:hypothetical protein